MSNLHLVPDAAKPLHVSTEVAAAAASDRTEGQARAGRVRSITTGLDSGKVDQVPIRDVDAQPFLEEGLLYTCGAGHGHDLHINPTRVWTADAIERLLSAVREAK